MSTPARALPTLEIPIGRGGTVDVEAQSAITWAVHDMEMLSAISRTLYERMQSISDSHWCYLVDEMH